MHRFFWDGMMQEACASDEASERAPGGMVAYLVGWMRTFGERRRSVNSVVLACLSRKGQGRARKNNTMTTRVPVKFGEVRI